LHQTLRFLDDATGQIYDFEAVAMTARVVLVHGAWHGAWCWDRVAAECESLGLEVQAPELAFLGFDSDVAEVRKAIGGPDNSVVLCGHSYGGMVITAAASGSTAVKRLVYLAAMQPDAGETMGEIIVREPSMIMEALIEGPGGSLMIDPARLHEVVYADSDPAAVDVIAPLLRPMDLSTDPPLATEPAWRTIPSTYIACTNDRVIPVAAQRWMAERAGSEVVEWGNDHSPFLTRPRDLAEILASYS
jgi:pimeloyl-ACP methyl ester carboxylesterase